MQLQPLTEFDYHHTLARTPGACLVLFSSPDCGSCRTVESLLPAAVGDTIRACYKVNVQQATALARQYDIFHLPALFLYKDGHFHAILQSEITPTRLQDAIRAALAKPPEDEP